MQNNFFNNFIIFIASAIQQCKFDDNKCFAEAFSFVVNNYASSGNKDINLEVIEPLDANDVHSPRDANNPINIELTIKNFKLYGLGKLRISKVG